MRKGERKEKIKIKIKTLDVRFSNKLHTTFLFKKKHKSHKPKYHKRSAATAKTK